MQVAQELTATGENRHARLGLTDAEAVGLYRAMLLARRMSERTMALAFQGRVAIAVSAEGHEASQVGAVAALEPADYLYPFYRGIGSALTRGQSAAAIMLEHFGRAEGPTAGRPMPCHWTDPSLHLISNSSSVGTHIPHAVGTALAARLRGEAAVAYASFGEGAVSKGDFHEGLNFAAIHKLPVILVCENNGYVISAPFRLESPIASVADRAPAYGVPGVSVDGMDVLAVYAAVREARARAIRGEGPSLIEARVYRYGYHTSHVGQENYRSPEEIERQRARDPVPNFRAYLQGLGLLTESDAAGLAAEVDAEVDAAVRAAEQASPPPRELATQQVLVP